MISQAKRATVRAGLGFVALVSISAGAMASDMNLDSYHVNMIDGGNSGQTTDLSGYSHDTVPSGARVTIPRVSGVELFSNQAVFSLGATSFSENKAVSAIHQNADEAQFWQSTVITGTGATTIGTPSAEQMALYNTSTAASLAVKPTNLAATINDSANFTSNTTRKTSSQDLGIPTLNAGGLISGPSSVLASPTSLNSNATAASLAVAKQESLASPEMSRDISGPEPASLGLLGIFAVGLLGRRRAR